MPILALALAAALQAPPTHATQAVASAVGMTRRAWVDSTRARWDGTGPRPIRTTVWYPAAAGAREDTVRIGPPERPLFVAGTAAMDAPAAPMARGGRRPLVLLSHGTGGSALQLMWLGRALAARGFVVAAVDHHGNTGAEPAPAGPAFVLWWERARDLSVALDRLLADPTLGPTIDRDRIGAAGFSLGGYTVVALAGGITDLAGFETFCAGPEHDAACDKQTEAPADTPDDPRALTDTVSRAALARASASYRDPRIRRIVALAPAIGHAFTPASLRAIRVPVRIIVGDADPIAPAKTNAAYLAATIPGARLTVLPGVAHYTFLSECGAAGRKVLGVLCAEGEGVERGRVHAVVGGMVGEAF